MPPWPSVVLVLAILAQPAFAATDATKILNGIDDLFRGTSSRGKMSMKVVTEQWTRELSLEQWSKGKDRFLVRILAPQKEKGTGTLKTSEGIWNYLPKVARVMKLPPSMMGGAWMGSHFTNDDLVQRNRLADSFTHQVTFEGERDGQKVVEITLIPKPDAAIVWGKVVVVARAADNIPLSFRYFDEDQKLARTTTFSDVKKLGGRTVPALLKVVPADKPGESTEVRYESLEFDVPLDDSFFSLRSLEK